MDRVTSTIGVNLGFAPRIFFIPFRVSHHSAFLWWKSNHNRAPSALSPVGVHDISRRPDRHSSALHSTLDIIHRPPSVHHRHRSPATDVTFHPPAHRLSPSALPLVVGARGLLRRFCSVPPRRTDPTRARLGERTSTTVARSSVLLPARDSTDRISFSHSDSSHHTHLRRVTSSNTDTPTARAPRPYRRHDEGEAAMRRPAGRMRAREKIILKHGHSFGDP